ncbi:MSMEG_6728 family protein [Streptomyces peucetius]|uniref:MSMEG_6728 family protein n=1 Tax=Streptomyces peucetius TaxID=1950 RepID=UPI0039AF0042
MQTFLPYPDFRSSALVLDRRRLGKQRVEALQVLRGLVVPGYGWRHHPAVRMWAGYEEALVRYGLEVCKVWREQGHQDGCAATLVADLLAFRHELPGQAEAQGGPVARQHRSGHVAGAVHRSGCGLGDLRRVRQAVDGGTHHRPGDP